MKFLGQHFLKNKTAIAKIVAVLDLQSGEMVIEIGPGHGELTEELVKNPVKIIAVEKDWELAKKLKTKNEKLKILEGDILKILPEITHNLQPKTYKLIGNIPYYITGFLFRMISELENKPSTIIFTIQKEVAERIVAQPPKMNLLAASIQIWAKPEIIAILPPSDFEPPPKVKSAIIRLIVKNIGFRIENLGNYYKLLKIIFKQPRKIILNNLTEGLTIPKTEIIKKLESLHLTGQERGQNLTLEILIKLSQILIPKS